DITTEQGIGLRLLSMEGNKVPVVNTREIHGTNPWTLIGQSWTASPDTHRVQICLTRDPSDNPEVRISGSAWVDDVNLLLETAERRKP
ncbi:MAG: hypothetical protein WBL63_01060, partial [Candidatus Acidiferrum sp.]